MKLTKKPQRDLPSKIVRKVSALLPVLFLVILTTAIFGLSATIKKKKTQIAEEQMNLRITERPAANVVLLDVATTTMHDRINLPGVIEPWRKLAVLAKNQGTLLELHVHEGQKVTKGQLLARIDPADYHIALDSARANFELAAAHQKRMALLLDKGIIPKAEMEEVDAQQKTTRAQMDKAQLMLSRCNITAPISGRVRRIHAREGNVLKVFDPVAEILEIDRVKAVVGIPESDVALVRNINDVTLTIQALDNEEFVGRFHVLASSPDNNARLYRLELAIDNTDNRILPGMFFRAQVVKRVIHEAVAIPLFTVIKRRDKQYVFAEENGIAKQLPVELGIIEDWQVEVTRGISPGSRIVVEGHRDIDQGHTLNIVRVISDSKGALL